MAHSKILITASTGNVGTPLSKTLHSKGIPFTAATREPEKATQQLGFKADTVYLNFRDPSGFEPALKGRDIVFICGPSGTPGAEKLLTPLVKEAIQQKPQHIVFIASYPALNELIEKSGIPYTLIRANFFMQNFEMYQTEDIRDYNQIFLPVGTGKTPFIHARDIGEVAAEVIEHPGDFTSETLYITGPEALDHAQAADIFSHVLKRKITFRNPTDEAYREDMKERGFSDAYINAMIAVFGKIRKGKVSQISNTVEQILERPATALDEYVVEKKKHFS